VVVGVLAGVSGDPSQRQDVKPLDDFLRSLDEVDDGMPDVADDRGSTC
jgi:hypothetical protein